MSRGSKTKRPKIQNSPASLRDGVKPPTRPRSSNTYPGARLHGWATGRASDLLRAFERDKREFVFPALGITALCAAIGLTINLLFLRDDIFLAFLVSATGLGTIAAKASIYEDEFRWRGLLQVSKPLVIIWRWWIRLMLFAIIGGAYLLRSRPDFISGASGEETSAVIAWCAHLLPILMNIWFCGFVLFGDNTVASDFSRKFSRQFRELLRGTLYLRAFDSDESSLIRRPAPFAGREDYRTPASKAMRQAGDARGADTGPTK